MSAEYQPRPESRTLLFSAEYARPSAPNTMLKVVQLMPTPTKMPIASVSPSAVLEFAMNTRPSAYRSPPAKSTRRAPKRSASIPVNGCVMPHNRFCSATAKPNTSRPHPLSMLIGCRNRPKLWRMPSARVRITLAQTSMTVGPGLRKSGMSGFQRGEKRDRISRRDHRDVTPSIVSITPLSQRLFPLLRWWPRVDRSTLRADALAGLIGAVVVLPQGVAFATLAGLPPEYGLYCAMVPTVVAAL